MVLQYQPTLYAIDYTRCDRLADLAPSAIVASFTEVLSRAGATVVDSVSHTFPGVGLTSVLILQESHAVIHTWPETGTVHVDIFSCSTNLRALDAVAELSAYLGAGNVSVQEFLRADGHGGVGVPTRASD